MLGHKTRDGDEVSFFDGIADEMLIKLPFLISTE
jgi:hypothetical protein